MSSRSVSNQAQIGLAQAKQAPERILKINAVCNFCTMKSAAELNRLDFFFDGHHGAASGIYWVHYKPAVFSCSGVGNYVMSITNLSPRDKDAYKKCKQQI